MVTECHTDVYGISYKLNQRHTVYLIHIRSVKYCVFGCLDICMFVTQYRKNGWTDLDEIWILFIPEKSDHSAGLAKHFFKLPITGHDNIQHF